MMKHTQKIVQQHQRKFGTSKDKIKIEITPVSQIKEAAAGLSIDKMNPLINIITRTSGRPNAFKRCRESIIGQTYKNIRHIVSIDNLSDEIYVKDSGVDYFFIDRVKLESEPDIPDPKTGQKFIFNRYFNVLFSKVNDGWVIILDDDDYLSSPNIIEEIVSNVGSNTDMFVWQMQYETGNLLPPTNEMGQIPRLGRIGSPCVMIHHAIAKTIVWDGWKCGDFRYIAQAWKKTQNKIFIKKPVVKIGGAGHGLRRDSINPKKTDNIEIYNTENKIIITNTINENNISKDKLPVSILITAYKTSKYIEDCLMSIENQDYFNNNNNFEVIVGVDGCKDTWDVLVRVKNKCRNVTALFFERNMGTYVTMNSLFDYINYDNIIRFDSDDIMKPNMVTKIMDSANLGDLIRFKFTSFRDNTKNISPQDSGKMYAVGTIFVKKSVISMSGGYDNTRFSGDSEFIHRVDKFVKKHNINDQIFYYRRHQNSLSITVPKRDRKKYDDRTRTNIYTKDNIKITPIKNTVNKIQYSRGFKLDIIRFFNNIKNNKPFSLVRYGDGEMMIIENKCIDLTKKFNGEHAFFPNEKKYQDLRCKLSESIQFRDSTYFVGLPCKCCVGEENAKKVYNFSGQHNDNITWANIFVNSNFKYFTENLFTVLSNKPVALICHKKADTSNIHLKVNIVNEFRVGVNAWAEDSNQIENILEYSKLCPENTVFIFAAGTFTKIVIYEMHKIRKDLFLLDVGSALDKVLGLGCTRGYHNDNHQNKNKICTWIV